MTTDRFIPFTAYPYDGACFGGHTSKGQFLGFVVDYEKGIQKYILAWHTVLASGESGFDCPAVVQG